MMDEPHPSDHPLVDEAEQAKTVEGSSSSNAKCCKECNLTFGTLAKYKYHRLKFHGAWKAGLSCPDCHSTFSSLSNLKRHRKKVHEREADSSSSFICSFPSCSYAARDYHELTIHMRKHTGKMAGQGWLSMDTE